MSSTLKTKRTSVAAKVPTAGELELGEICINTYDGKMYIKKDAGTPEVIEIAPPGGSVAFTSVTGKPTTLSGYGITDGATLPSQTGNSGKYLTTNGTATSWAAPTFAYSSLTGRPTTLAGFGITDATELLGKPNIAGNLGCRHTFIALSRTSTTTTTGELFVNGVNNSRIVLQPKSINAFKITVIGKYNSAPYSNLMGHTTTFTGTILRNAAATGNTVGFTSTPVKTSDIGADAAYFTGVTLTADSTNAALVIKAAGDNSGTVYWYAIVELFESYG